MKKYMLLHFDFEPPTQEIMAQWNAWFESVARYRLKTAVFTAGRGSYRRLVRQICRWDQSLLLATHW